MTDTKHHRLDSCNKCGCQNTIIPTDTVDRIIYEANTKCKSCGFEDRWSFGFYESSQDMHSICKKY